METATFTYSIQNPCRASQGRRYNENCSVFDSCAITTRTHMTFSRSYYTHKLHIRIHDNANASYNIGSTIAVRRPRRRRLQAVHIVKRARNCVDCLRGCV